MENVLTVNRLCKNYKSFSLTNVSFEIPEGCIVGFIGVNGAGKTTTIRTLLGLTKKTTGDIKFFDKEFKNNEKEIKNRIGVVFDEGYFYDELSMKEMKRIIAPSYSNWSEEKYLEYMALFALDSKQKIITLSKGMRMKFALALALSHNAEFLIMDEPTSGLDPLIRSQLLEIMTTFMKQGGKGVFFSTHITSDLEKIADLLVFIHNGTIVFVEEKDALLEKYKHIKGDNKFLTKEIKELFLTLDINEYGFSGITTDYDKIQKQIPNIIVEKPTIEDIMLCYIKGGTTNV